MAFFTIALSPCTLFKLNGGDSSNTTGLAFPFVKALEVVNTIQKQFKIVLITNNPDLSHLNDSIKQNNLNIDETCVINENKSLCDHLHDLRPILYLSTVSENVKEAIKAGYGAATISQRDVSITNLSYDKLRVAFDGDGVLFSDESERVFKKQGLQAFSDHEKQSEGTALKLGPLGMFANALLLIQQKFSDDCPIRTYLVTSRGTDSPGIRALRTLQKLELGIDEALFLCGSNKGPVLKTIKPHIFFDDQQRHVKSALDEGVVGAHVPFGVANE